MSRDVCSGERVKSKVRIDPSAGPDPKPPSEPKPMPAWVRSLLLGVTGAALSAACQFVPIPVVKAVCVAVASVVASVPVVVPGSSAGADAGGL